MDSVNKTLYIPLYGKSYVSGKGLFISDKKAEEIWQQEGFALKGKAKSKWLAYYMGIRCAVFDEWLKQQAATNTDAVIIHLGCGMDSRALRVGTGSNKWYDVDFADVINERKRYYTETDNYKMIAGDVRENSWLCSIDNSTSAIVVMEGISMYLTNEDLKQLTSALSNRFEKLCVLMDCYTTFAAKMSKYKNPVNDVGVTQLYGIDNPRILENDKFCFAKEHDMTPQKYIDELCGGEKIVFEKLYAGKASEKLYRLFEYKNI